MAFIDLRLQNPADRQTLGTSHPPDWQAPNGVADRALTAVGFKIGNVLKMTNLLAKMSNFEAVVNLRRRFFRSPYPADRIVEVKALYTPEARFEIEAVAIVHPKRGGTA